MERSQDHESNGQVRSILSAPSLRQFAVAKVIELPTKRHRVTRDTFMDDEALDNNVIQFPTAEIPPEDPEAA